MYILFQIVTLYTVVGEKEYYLGYARFSETPVCRSADVDGFRQTVRNKMNASAAGAAILVMGLLSVIKIGLIMEPTIIELDLHDNSRLIIHRLSHSSIK